MSCDSTHPVLGIRCLSDDQHHRDDHAVFHNGVWVTWANGPVTQTSHVRPSRRGHSNEEMLGVARRIQESRERRDDAMDRVSEAADPAWKEAAFRWLEDYLRTHPDPFIIDDLWDQGLPPCREPRAMGPLVVKASRQKLMEQTGDFRPSTVRHLSPSPVWRSLIYEQDA